MVEKGETWLPWMGSTKYDLVANICHDVDLEEDREKRKRNPLMENPVAMGSYRIHLKNNADDEWYEIQELVVKPTRAELVMLSESSILVFERKDWLVCFSKGVERKKERKEGRKKWEMEMWMCF